MGLYLNHLEPIDEYVHTPPSLPRKLYPIPDKWETSLTVFRPKRRKNLTLWGGTYLYGLYKGASVEIKEITEIFLTSSICRNVSRTELPQNY